MRIVCKFFIPPAKDSEGATAVEYAIILALISAVIMVTVGFLGVSTREAFTKVNSGLSDVAPTSTPTPTEEDKNKCGDKDSPDDDDCGIGND